MKFNRKSKVGSAIPTASMADISFLLLVFFMVSTVFVRYRGVPVELPQAEKIEKLESRRNVLQLWVSSSGSAQQLRAWRAMLWLVVTSSCVPSLGSRGR